MTFSSFNNANPFMDLYDEFVPPMPVLAIPELKSPDPVKMSRGQGIPQSRSEGQICSPRTLPGRYNESCNQLVQSYGTNEHGTTHARGRVPSRDIPQAMGTLPGANEKPAVHLTESRKRSRSPVKRFLGLGKSQSMKEIPQEKEPTDENEKKAGLKLWGDRLRHGFLVRVSFPYTPTILTAFRQTLSRRRISTPPNQKLAEPTKLQSLPSPFPFLHSDKPESTAKSNS